MSGLCQVALAEESLRNRSTAVVDYGQETDELGSVRPWQADLGNAIVHAGFGVILRDPLEPVLVREVAALPYAVDHFPRVQVSVPKGFHHLESNLPPLEGFTRASKSGEEFRGMRLGAMKDGGYGVSLLISSYRGWEREWNREARPLFEAIWSVLPDDVAVSRCHLWFDNRFVWEDEPGLFSPDLLLKSRVSGLANGSRSPLRSDRYSYSEQTEDLEPVCEATGFIDVSGQKPDSEREDAGLWIDINMFQSLAFGSDGTGIGAKAYLAEGTLDRQMEYLHDRHKRMLVRLLSEDVCRKIKVVGG